MARNARHTAPIVALLTSLVPCAPALAAAEARPEMREDARREESASHPSRALSDISFDASLLVVGQRALGGTTGGKDESRLNYRADIELGLAAGNIGAAEGELFAHLRMGQGTGLRRLPHTLTGTANSTIFAPSDGDDVERVLAQLWYGLKMPLGGRANDAQSSLAINLGKIDPFVFFDQNDIADDESAAFMNNVFVHNPLLDSGGDMGVDPDGFAPGLRVAYRSERQNDEYWQASLGAFSPADDSLYDIGTTRPFVIGQVEAGGNRLAGRQGTYRLYAWSQARAVPYGNESSADSEHHGGWGLSANQQVAEHVGLFGRYGRSVEGKVRFDRALTLGAEIGGSYWGREDDRIGLAAGWLGTSKAFRADAPALDADGDGAADFGYSAGRAEKQFEVYYAWRVNAHLEISTDFQWLEDPGADPSAKDISIVGLRAKAFY